MSLLQFWTIRSLKSHDGPADGKLQFLLLWCSLWVLLLWCACESLQVDLGSRFVSTTDCSTQYAHKQRTLNPQSIPRGKSTKICIWQDFRKAYNFKTTASSEPKRCLCTPQWRHCGSSSMCSNCCYASIRWPIGHSAHPLLYIAPLYVRAMFCYCWWITNYH